MDSAWEQIGTFVGKVRWGNAGHWERRSLWYSMKGSHVPRGGYGRSEPMGDYRPWPGNETGVQNRNKQSVVRLRQESNPTTQKKAS